MRGRLVPFGKNTVQNRLAHHRHEIRNERHQHCGAESNMGTGRHSHCHIQSGPAAIQHTGACVRAQAPHHDGTRDPGDDDQVQHCESRHAAEHFTVRPGRHGDWHASGTSVPH